MLCPELMDTEQGRTRTLQALEALFSGKIAAQYFLDMLRILTNRYGKIDECVRTCFGQLNKAAI